MIMNNSLVQREIRRFLREDIGPGDLTTGCLPGLADRVVEARFAAREAGTLAGLDFALEVFRALDPRVAWAGVSRRDGSTLAPGEGIATVRGPAPALLTGERTALNILQRLSGIATQARRFASALDGSRTVLLDTRKTTPGFRYFEKYAVRVGGGHNHRLGLFDGVMIKDNHIAAVGGITEAVRCARAHAPVTVRVEVEADTLDQVREAVEAGADIIMLDNMPPGRIAEAQAVIAGKALVEVSGRVRLEDLPALASLGVDFISTSAVVTRAPWLDIGLDM
ncbi:MAG: carboxylating nicotinate-nucleotide diphosphorylase [Acidobacteria bacterium]|nr:carboxylating nicotinate-nucleotide diphosphorylase [Acidobacteriota bacterium]